MTFYAKCCVSIEFYLVSCKVEFQAGCGDYWEVLSPLIWLASRSHWLWLSKHRYNVSHADLICSGFRITPKIIIRSDVFCLMVLCLDHTGENNCSAAPRLDKMAPGLARTGHMFLLRIARDENASEWESEFIVQKREHELYAHSPQQWNP